MGEQSLNLKGVSKKRVCSIPFGKKGEIHFMLRFIAL